MKQTGWNVYREWTKGKFVWIDKVFFNPGISAEEVKASLINHDGYTPIIKVVKDN